ncbi:hypothetical protein [Helicobacter saguini]|uniref:Uncharacterized protein n=1 Tax=Helicobacter saguini TaxID=1548018 RepID=A0A6B0HMM9_9HELI|nr:hypothetical protein [Helicobacter saguini]MWV62788.1 hypothetical protein [Helicobacter saguini]MWV68892.1 hypothetical protein [Helicobacter saguini]MWV71554.1 hypothetical protein [Helicobacter saguini]
MLMMLDSIKLGFFLLEFLALLDSINFESLRFARLDSIFPNFFLESLGFLESKLESI